MDNKNELKATFDEMKDEYLEHYGTKRHSGRYPWGSGDDPYQHEDWYSSHGEKKNYDTAGEWLADYNKLKKEGISEVEIAKAFDFGSTTALRAARRAAGVYTRNEERAKAVKYQKEGKGPREIARLLGYANDSSVRSLLNEQTNQNKNKIFEVAKQIKDAVDKYQRVDVGEGSEQDFGVTQETLEQALYILQAEYGYKIKVRNIQQRTNPGQFTRVRAAVPPDAPNDFLFWKGLENRIVRVKDYGYNPNPNEAVNLKPKFEKPSVLARNRLMIRYREEGGLEKDGLIELRPGVKDLSLGDSNYSQVRIAVADEKGEPKYYLKGMAVYNKNLPKGVDVVINTNKPKYEEDDKHQIVRDENGNPVPTKDKKALKELKKIKGTDEIDWENPFGSTIKEDGGQYWYTDSDGKEKLGLINKRADEGDWLGWSKSLPSQFLAKQNPKFVKRQLKLTVAEKVEEFEEIKKVTNPVVKQKLLDDFAGSLDSQAVHLKAASLPRQKYEVIMPVNSLKDNEVFATNFNPGEKIALVRFPHAGPFEIPILTVNNKNKEALEMFGPQSKDVIGINSYNAGILSGADFDGDTVIAIPLSDTVNITAKKPLKDLKGFEGKDEYPPEYKLDSNGNKVLDEKGDPIIISEVMSKKNLQKQMGEVSNLITDMSLMGANDEELARAVRHSMVVVDSPKHKLNYKKSEIDNGIAELKKKYQAHETVKFDEKTGEWVPKKVSTSAATLLSAAKAQKSVPVHEGRQVIDPETGKLVWTRPGYKKTYPYVDKKTGELVGEEKFKTMRSNWMSDTDDAFTLVRDMNNPIEVAYAEYANALKALANEVRKERVATDNLKYSPEAAEKYSKEVNELNVELKKAQGNRPREREAQQMAGIMFEEEITKAEESGVELDKEEIKKLNDRLIKKARAICGASRYEILITDKQWEAIQAGALTHTKVAKILDRANPDSIKQRATPKKVFEWTPAKQNIAKAMADAGWTTADIANRIGASTTTVSDFLSERR